MKKLMAKYIWVAAAIIICVSLQAAAFAKDKNGSRLTLITPKTSFIQNSTQTKNQFGAIFNSQYYDISFVYYDHDFAEEFGLDQKNVVDMNDGLRLIEAKVFTEGKDTYCYYNFVLDKSVKIDLPEENYQAKITESDMDLSGKMISKIRNDAVGISTFKNVFSQIPNKKVPVDLRYNAKTLFVSEFYDGKFYKDSLLSVIAYIINSPLKYQILVTEIPCYRNYFNEYIGKIKIAFNRSGYDKNKDSIDKYYYWVDFPEEIINSLKALPKITPQNKNPLLR